MRIAIDEIDPEIAAKYTGMARPESPLALTPVRVSLLTVSMAGAPLIGFGLANLVADHVSRSLPMPQVRLLAWLIWLAVWSAASALGVRLALDRRLSRRAEASLFVPLAGSPLMAWIACSSTFGHTAISFPVAATIWFTLWLGSFALAARNAVRPIRKRRQGKRLDVSEAQEVFSQLSLTRAERLYCDVLQFLTRTTANADTEPMLRDTLRQLNTLVAANRELEQKRVALIPLLGNNAPSELQAEIEALSQRLARTSDPIARQSIEQSLQMCRTRLENSRALHQGLERIQARQEAIAQTISSAQSAMARLQIVPEVQTQAVAQEISESIAYMNQQTYQVEQAVQEVLTLNTQG